MGESYGNLFYKSATFWPFRKGVKSGSATTMYCTVCPDVPDMIEKGRVYFYNRAPQRLWGIARPGRRDDLIEALDKKQMDLVREFIGDIDGFNIVVPLKVANHPQKAPCGNIA